MPEAIVTTPTGPLWATVSDFTTYVDGDSKAIQYGQQCVPMRANAAITKYDLVGLVAATTTVPLSVEQLDVSDAFAEFVCFGIAQEAATAAGDIIQVCTRGVSLVNIGNSGAIALGDIAVKHGSTDGCATLIASGTWTADATAAAGPGKAVGVFLGPEVGTSNTAPVYFWKF